MIRPRDLRVSPILRGFGSRLRVFQRSLIDYDEEYLPATFKSDSSGCLTIEEDCGFLLFSPRLDRTHNQPVALCMVALNVT